MATLLLCHVQTFSIRNMWWHFMLYQRTHKIINSSISTYQFALYQHYNELWLHSLGLCLRNHISPNKFQIKVVELVRGGLPIYKWTHSHQMAWNHILCRRDCKSKISNHAFLSCMKQHYWYHFGTSFKGNSQQDSS